MSKKELRDKRLGNIAREYRNKITTVSTKKALSTKKHKQGYRSSPLAFQESREQTQIKDDLSILIESYKTLKKNFVQDNNRLKEIIKNAAQNIKQRTAEEARKIQELPEVQEVTERLRQIRVNKLKTAKKVIEGANNRDLSKAERKQVESAKRLMAEARNLLVTAQNTVKKANTTKVQTT